MENDGSPSLERVQGWRLARVDWEQFQHLCSTRLHQSAIADADDPMPLFTSILKDIAEKSIHKTSAVPKRFNKSWFTDTYIDATKERNWALERFKKIEKLSINVSSDNAEVYNKPFSIEEL